MDRGLGSILAATFVAFSLVGCATTPETSHQEGDVIFQAGGAGTSPADLVVVPGPAIQRLAMLVPTPETAWQAVWLGADKNEGTTTGKGAFAGFLFGLGIVSSIPFSLVAWPVAAGVVAGTTAMGMLGEQMDPTALSRVEPGDRQVLQEAAASLHPDRLLRESAAAALAGRTSRPPLLVSWSPAWGPDTAGSDPFADARKAGADGVLDLTVEAYGLATGEDSESFGVFVRLRARLVETASGQLRYERVLQHGPGRPLAGMPRPGSYTLEFLALDQARVFRYEMREVIARMASILARDPALPLGPS